MPNHISNRLTLLCSEDEAARVFAAIAGSNKDGSATLIDFNKLIPYPEEYVRLDRESREWEKSHPENPWKGRPADGFNQGGYQWCVDNWGTKWSAYDQEKRSLTSIYFETAWSPPVPVMDALAARFPDLRFMLEYADEDIGSNAGVIRYAKGRKGVGTLGGAEAVRLWFDLNPTVRLEDRGYCPITLSYIPEDE